MANYQEAEVKSTNTHVNKLKSAVKLKAGTMLRTSKKNVQDEELLHVLLLTTRQTTKITNAIAKNESTDIKVSGTQISKMIQLGGFICNILGNLSKKSNNRPCFFFS